jgi:hypothetical protein
MEIWIAHGDLICLWRLIALLSHDLSPKGFYSGRDKSDLEGMTSTFNNDRSIRRGTGRCGRKDKESNFSFLKNGRGSLWLLCL